MRTIKNTQRLALLSIIFKSAINYLCKIKKKIGIVQSIGSVWCRYWLNTRYRYRVIFCVAASLIYIYAYTVQIIGLVAFIYRRVILRPQLGLFDTVFIGSLSSGTWHGHFQRFARPSNVAAVRPC